MTCVFLANALPVGTLFVEWVAKPIKRQIDYLRHFKDNVENFTGKKEDLGHERERLQREIKVAGNKLLDIGDGVQAKLDKADDILTDAESMQQEIDKDKRCFCRCPNWWWRYRLSRNLEKKKLVAISEHLDKMAKIGQPELVGYGSVNTVSTIEFLSSKDFMVSNASEKAFTQTFEALRDDNVSMIGVWGMGGSGKTTLVREVGNQAEKSNLFDKVVFTTVSQKPNFHAIQDEIAKYLGDFNMNVKGQRRSTQELWLRLQQEGKILIILDDVWAEIKLKEKIGIPLGEDHKGCKVLLTTRSLDICRRMECQKPVQLDCLDDEEAWALFEKKARLENSDDAIKKVARRIVQKCEGLPIALVALGSALKGNTNLQRWEATYRQLRDRRLDDIEGIDQSTDQNAYRCLEVSFDFLKMETKMCFLLCSLFPEDHEINVEDLVRYAWGLELCRSVDSVEKVRSDVHAAVDILKNSCLLMESEVKSVRGSNGSRVLKMHDLVRDVALWIASAREDISFMIKSEVVEKWPKNESFERYTAISSKNSQIDKLPQGLICPNLKILLLGGEDFQEINPELVRYYSCSLKDGLLAPEAFQSQTNLRTFHLESCELLDISMLRHLTNLRTLHLESCSWELLDFSLLGELKNLEVLSFSQSEILELPEKIGDLNNLKLLDLSGCLSLQRIPYHLLQGLSKIEELYLDGCRSIKWATESRNPEQSFASVSELNSLPNLTVLSLGIAVQFLPEGFVFPRLQRYSLTIDLKESSYDDYYQRNDVYKTCRKYLEIEASMIDACKHLFPDSEFLSLRNLEGRQNLNLSNSMKCLIDTTSRHVPTCAFFELVNLSLEDLPDLEELCKGPQPQGFLQKLKALRIDNCRKMTGAIPILQTLERLELNLCDRMKVLFQQSEIEVSNISLQQALSHHVSLRSLKSLKIDGCNELRYIFPETVADSLGQLEILRISQCLELKEIILGMEVSKINLQSLREVYIDECDNLTSLSSLSHGQILQNLNYLTIRRCSRLKYTFSNSMAACLPQLNGISLAQLPQLKGKDGNDIALTLPSLQKLNVSCCPLLTPFIISAQIQELTLDGFNQTEQMGSMEIVPELRRRSANMEYLTITNFQDYLFDAAFNLSSLKYLELRRLPELRVVWKGSIQVVNFQNLIDLEVHGCRRLRYIFSSPTTARCLPQLRSLVIKDCPELEQIIGKYETSSQHHQPNICFPNLTEIEIRSCANLKCLLPVSIACGLLKLKGLVVREVSELENVFGKGDEANVSGDKEKVILPQLDELRLRDLPQLKGFSPMGYHFVFPSLVNLTVESCPNTITRFSVDSKQWVHAITGEWKNIVEESAMTHQTTREWPIGSDIYWKRRKMRK